MNKDAKYLIVIAALLVVIGFLILRKSPSRENNDFNHTSTNVPVQEDPPKKKGHGGQTIEELTKEENVIPFVKKNNSLPDCYITKSEARREGWDAGHGNLCDVLPGKAIGGDRFSNREHSLPNQPGRIWYEADLNYSCGHRNADRLLFSNDGLVYVTYDHYQNFIEK